MKTLNRIVSTFFAVAVFPFCFYAKALVHWEKRFLRVDVQCFAERAIRRATGHRLCGNNRTYANVCGSRIKILEKFLKNAILLPIEVDAYLRDGGVSSDSYEAETLKCIASRTQEEKSWKEKIRGLIQAYKEIRAEYEEDLID